MTYSPNIPQSTDDPSVSQGQMLTNFQQLNTLFALDHYAFDDATSANRGHHKTAQFNQLGGDPAVALNPGGALYAKNAGASTNSGLFWKNANTSTVYSMMVCLRNGAVSCPSGTTTVTAFAGLPAMAGMALAIDVNTQNRTLLSPFYWNGSTTLEFPGVAGQLAAGATLVRFISSGTNAQLVTTSNITVNVRYFGELV